MPFTPAHAAVVLPLIRVRLLSATGLIVGSMAPDFEYFFKMSVDGVHGHTWAGLIYFDLPVTIGLSLLFHLYVKKNLITNLPGFLQRRFAPALFFDFLHGFRHRPVVFIVSGIIGSASHIVWDGFTHGNGYFVMNLSFYEGSYVPFDGVKYPLWYALQHISTYAGMTVVVVVILFTRAVDFPVQRVQLKYWIVFILIMCFVVGARFLVYQKDYNLGNLVVSAITAICVALIVCGKMNAGKVQRHD
jgi:hypothetical protein